MKFRVLGKLEVVRDGRSIDLGAFRQRALLGLLLTSPNSVFTTDQILEGLWGADGGADKQSSLWVYVSGLRSALEPDRVKRSEGTILLTRAPGYLVEIAPDNIDSVNFERMVARGRALAETDPAAASSVLGDALALWRGRPFEDFTYESFAQGEIARLEELRLEAVEARIDADLKRGMSQELVPELESLVRQYPLQEHLTGQFMVALYRSGRQSDALRAYQLLKTGLGEELGLVPSARLRRLHEQIVTGDEALAVESRTSSVSASGPAVRGYEVRDRLGERGDGVIYRAYQPSVGREVAIKIIRPELADDPGFIRRFQAEAQLVARLEHPHIVPLYDYWREPGAAFLVMRLMKGGTLAAEVGQRALEPGEVLAIADHVGSALDTVHRAGLVHGDIQPANVLIDDDGNAYLADFGVTVDVVPPRSSPSLAGAVESPYVSPDRLDHGEVTAASDIFNFGVLVAHALTGVSGDLGAIGEALPPPVCRVIEAATATDPSERHATVAAFVADLHDAMGSAVIDRESAAVDSRTECDNPYKGLRSFGAADAGDFHGREQLVERLVARLARPGIGGRLVAVVGPSGSGKSSVVKAGLLPAVRRGAVQSSTSWFTIEMTPGHHPFEELERALLTVAVDPPAALLEQLAGANGIQNAVRRVLPPDGSRLLVVVDQFEELFTQVSADAADRFIDALVSGVLAEESPTHVVITLRADFYDRPLQHRKLGELLREGTEVVTPLTPEEIERAVVAPAASLGVAFEPALVAELVRDVVDRPGALPLLQYTLTELFDARRGNVIADASYRELGGVAGALVKRAEGLFASLGADARDSTRLVFLRLVTLGEGTGDTRRRVLQTELDQLGVDGQRLHGILDVFGRHRLLSFDRDPVTRGPTVEISHEALLTEWTRLRGWIDGARHDVHNQRRLADAMHEWEAADRNAEFLLRGGRLDQLHGWATTSTLPLSEPEQAFLDASVAARDEAEAEQRDREQRANAAELRERRRVHQLVAVGVAACVVAALAVFGTVQWRTADDARATADDARAAAEQARGEAERARLSSEDDRAQLEQWAQSALLVDSSTSALAEGDPELAVALAVQAIRETAVDGLATKAAIDALHSSLERLGVRYEVTDDTLVTVRPGPMGLTGQYVVAPSVLVAFAEAQVDRRLTEDECAAFYDDACPVTEVPIDTVTRTPFVGTPYGVWGGFSDTAPQGGRALEGTTVRIANAPAWLEPAMKQRLDSFTGDTGIQIEFVEPTRSGAGQPDVHLVDGAPAQVLDRPEVRQFLDYLEAGT